MKQIELLKKEKLSYGGELLKTRKGRSTPRPLDTKNTMHLVLRSAKAKGEWSFRRHQNAKKIQEIINKFSYKYGVKIISLANVGNHLHFQIKLTNRHTYKPFIRAITAAIAMAVTGQSRWNRNKNSQSKLDSKSDSPVCLRFWDYRPFTRVVMSFRGFLNLRDYIRINRIEGFGYEKNQARFLYEWNRVAFESG